MPNIKGISSDTSGNITIIKTDNSIYSLIRTNLIKIPEMTSKGNIDTSNSNFNIYTHCYIDATKTNTLRTATLICQKGFIPRNNWWVNN